MRGSGKVPWELGIGVWARPNCSLYSLENSSWSFSVPHNDSSVTHRKTQAKGGTRAAQGEDTSGSAVRLPGVQICL